MQRLSSLFCLCSLACGKGADSAEEGGPSFSYPLDDTRRMNQLQSLGTHNSYHVQIEGTNIEEWQYSHEPLDVQAGALGVRQYELDVNWDPETGAFTVYHVPVLDYLSTCDRLEDCLAALGGWSEENPGHHPMMVLLETKTEPDNESALTRMLDDLDAVIADGWPKGRLLTPDKVAEGHDSVAAALSSGGPTLGEVRGQTLFVLHGSETARSLYSEGFTLTAGRPLWPHCEGEVEAPACGLHIFNDPIGDAAEIARVVQAGHLVRTRSDGDSDEARANDYTKAEAALASGAHFISTDWPAPHPDTGYVVAMPGGTPSRCNPLTATADCLPSEIESPDQLH
jgi:hypothetical protein